MDLKPRIITPKLSSNSGLNDEEISSIKYRRMRDLNNAASKRFRENKKQEKEKIELELKSLKEKNIQLWKTFKLKLVGRGWLEDSVFFLKRMISSVSSSSNCCTSIE